MQLVHGDVLRLLPLGCSLSLPFTLLPRLLKHTSCAPPDRPCPCRACPGTRPPQDAQGRGAAQPDAEARGGHGPAIQGAAGTAVGWVAGTAVGWVTGTASSSSCWLAGWSWSAVAGRRPRWEVLTGCSHFDAEARAVRCVLVGHLPPMCTAPPSCLLIFLLQVAVWAQQHAQQMEDEAAQRLRQQQAEAAAADKARRAAAAVVARRAALGAKAGEGFAAVVQLAKQARQDQQQEAGAAGRAGTAAADFCSPGTAQRGRMLPALQLQKLTEHWHRTAAAAAVAAGEQTARQRQEAAARERVRQQWAAVKGRLPDAAD